MLGKVQSLVEALPDHQHTFYIPDKDFNDKVKALGYVTQLKPPGKCRYYHMCVSKKASYKDTLSYGCVLMDKSIPESIKVEIEYNNKKMISTATPPVYGDCMSKAFQGYDESINSLPEIYDKIITVLYGKIPVSVKYIHHSEATVDIARKPERLS